jgi:hypothetical protein
MPPPTTIRIRHEEAYSRFSLIGRTTNCQQFMGFVTGAMPIDWSIDKYSPEFLQANWMRFKRWYAVMHLFDLEGNHQKTEVRSGGTSNTMEDEDQSVQRAYEHLEQMFHSLGVVQFGDIQVKAFGFEEDGYFFGLVYEQKSHDDPGNPVATSEWVMLQPNDIMFHPPWDSGEYST